MTTTASSTPVVLYDDNSSCYSTSYSTASATTVRRSNVQASRNEIPDAASRVSLTRSEFERMRLEIQRLRLENQRLTSIDISAGRSTVDSALTDGSATTRTADMTESTANHTDPNEADDGGVGRTDPNEADDGGEGRTE